MTTLLPPELLGDAGQLVQICERRANKRSQKKVQLGCGTWVGSVAQNAKRVPAAADISVAND
jgi:hypothetical protein